MAQQFETLISEQDLRKRCVELAKDIAKHYGPRLQASKKELVILGVLKGSFIFLADLVRELSVPCKIEFIEVSSYGSGTVSSGEVKLLRDITIKLEDEDV